MGEVFLSDFTEGKKAQRYIEGELPLLPFETGCFDLALSSHFLFLYSDHFSIDFHIQSLAEMLRVAQEVRIFPIMTLSGIQSPYLQPICKHFVQNGLIVDIKPVSYEFQRGGNKMLVIKSLD